jgi:hypothetical protein
MTFGQALEVGKSDSMKEVCEQFSDTQFYFKMMKDSYVSKYQNLSNDETSAGLGNTFPDQERTEQLDIRSLLLSQPKNVLSELQFHKDLFSKLKFNYIESESQDKFLKRVLEIPALFVGEEDVLNLQEKISGQKEKLKSKKDQIHDKKQKLSELIENVAICNFIRSYSLAYDDVLEKKEQIERLVTRIEQVVSFNGIFTSRKRNLKIFKMMLKKFRINKFKKHQSLLS